MKIIYILRHSGVSLLLLSSTAFATPNASLLYYETDLGGGLWQYDYIFYNRIPLQRIFLFYSRHIIYRGIFTNGLGWKYMDNQLPRYIFNFLSGGATLTFKRYPKMKNRVPKIHRLKVIIALLSF